MPSVIELHFAADGKLMFGGCFLTIAGETQPYLARLEANRTLDRTFRPVIAGKTGGLYTQVNSIEVRPDGRVLIAGGFSSVNGEPRPGVARLLPDGTLDRSFNPESDSVPEVIYTVFVQPDEKIILDGWSVRRLNSDGSLDATFTNASRGEFEGLQADGKYVVSKLVGLPPAVTTVEGVTTKTGGYKYVLFRYNPDGTEDPSFSPVLNELGVLKATLADGSFILARGVNQVGALSKFVQIANTEPATQSLVLTADTATWLRSGTSPEVTRASFEFSPDGQAWTQLGAGVRINGGWQLNGLQLGSSGKVRARGFVRGNVYETVMEVGAGFRVEMKNYEPVRKILTLNVSARPGTLLALEMSTDLKQWSNLTTNVVAGEAIQFPLADLSVPHVFYRLRQISK